MGADIEMATPRSKTNQEDDVACLTLSWLLRQPADGLSAAAGVCGDTADGCGAAARWAPVCCAPRWRQVTMVRTRPLARVMPRIRAANEPSAKFSQSQGRRLLVLSLGKGTLQPDGDILTWGK